MIPGTLVTTVVSRRVRHTPVYRVRWIREAHWGALVARLESIRNLNHTLMAIPSLVPIYWVLTLEEAGRLSELSGA